jgi:hypothetical protein
MNQQQSVYLFLNASGVKSQLLLYLQEYYDMKQQTNIHIMVVFNISRQTGDDHIIKYQ